MSLIHIPCAPSANIGEEITRIFLMKQLPASRGFLLTNYHYPSHNGTKEIDLLVINERGVWLIEVKHWTGNINADQVYWEHNGRRYESPITSIETKAKMIASTLRDDPRLYEQGVAGKISVVGLVVLSRNDYKLAVDDPRADKVFRLDEALVTALTGDQYLYSPYSIRLTTPVAQLAQDVLVRRKVDPERRVVGSYRLLRELEPGEGYRVYEAQHVTIATRRARVKQYQVTNMADMVSQRDLREAARRFQQDMQALAQVEGHPNIVRAYDFLPDPDVDDTYWLILEWIEGQTLADRLEDKSPIALDQQLRILRALADALAFCHGAGIIHRNLTPDSVYLAADGNIKLGDFDFARVPDVGRTISKTGAPLTTNKYTSPEARVDARAADARSDLYALGAIWYDMAVRPKPKDPILLSRLGESNLPLDAVDLMRSLLAARPGDRPTSAQDIQEWLSLL